MRTCSQALTLRPVTLPSPHGLMARATASYVARSLSSVLVIPTIAY